MIARGASFDAACVAGKKHAHASSQSMHSTPGRGLPADYNRGSCILCGAKDRQNGE